MVHSIPPELLGSLLYDELAEQRDRLLFSEGTTGGALSFVPFSQSDGGSQHGCLLYPGNPALNTLTILEFGFRKLLKQHCQKYFRSTIILKPLKKNSFTCKVLTGSKPGFHITMAAAIIG